MDGTVLKDGCALILGDDEGECECWFDGNDDGVEVGNMDATIVGAAVGTEEGFNDGE